VRLGFRRSGAFTYRPYCDHCRACVPVRVPVALFVATRSQSRAEKRHSHLVPIRRLLSYDTEHYALYLKYQRARHPGGGMDQDSREQYQHFLIHSNVSTELYEFRVDGRLVMVSLVDRLLDGLSSVYTFFDPDPQIRGSSLGTYSILWQIRESARLGLQYVYLGYWIADSPKMAYKAAFRPIEGLIAGRWIGLPKTPRSPVL
jgi:arginyl-tRNA--protein-N-Asp/Glu arginylyltransferase